MMVPQLKLLPGKSGATTFPQPAGKRAPASMDGLSDGFSSIAANGFGPAAGAFVAAEQTSTDTTPRIRSKSTKSRSKAKNRTKRTSQLQVR